MALSLLLGACGADPTADIRGPRIQAGLEAEEAITWDTHIQPIFEEHCSPCHLGTEKKGCLWSCLANIYEANTELWTCCQVNPFADEPPVCDGGEPMTLAECGLVRIHGFLNDGKDPIPPDQVQLIEAWVAAGMPR